MPEQSDSPWPFPHSIFSPTFHPRSNFQIFSMLQRSQVAFVLLGIEEIGIFLVSGQAHAMLIHAL